MNIAEPEAIALLTGKFTDVGIGKKRDKPISAGEDLQATCQGARSALNFTLFIQFTTLAQCLRTTNLHIRPIQYASNGILALRDLATSTHKGQYIPARLNAREFLSRPPPGHTHTPHTPVRSYASRKVESPISDRSFLII